MAMNPPEGQRDTLTLYGARCSLYTAKVRSYLLKYSIPFVDRYISDPHYQGVVLPLVENHRIPVVEFPDGSAVQDSTLILDALDARYAYVQQPMGIAKLIETFLEAYSERSLLKAAMHFRWNYLTENHDFIISEFGRALALDSPPERQRGLAEKFAGRMSGYLEPLGVVAGTWGVVEQTYFELLGLLDRHFAKHPYLLGGLPSRGDFGLMGPLYAHLGRDPYPLRLMQKTASRVFGWVERMNTPGICSADFPRVNAVFFEDDALPESLEKILEQAVKEYLPEIHSTVAAFEKWHSAHPNLPSGSYVSSKGEDQPSFGSIEFVVNGIRIRQASSGHTLWMVQRVLQNFASLPGDVREKARHVFGRASAQSLFEITLPRALSRRNNRLGLA